MSVYVLDTSALLVHYFDEEGVATVHELLAGEEVVLAAPTLFEFRVSAVRAGVAADRVESDLAAYVDLCASIVSVDASVAETAWVIRSGATTRVPAVDCLIAACAASRAAVLVHRDPHFLRVPPSICAQRFLG